MTRLILALFIGLLFVAPVAAQTPATVHASWNPNVASDNVVQYVITLDSAAPVVVLAATCTATTCTTALTVPTFGLHSVALVAQNLKFAGDPTSLQSGPAATVSFTLGAVPAVVAGGRVGN